MRCNLICVLLLATSWTVVIAETATDENEEDTAADAVALTFRGYPEASTFTVAPLNKKIKSCSRCHAKMETDPTVRVLADAPHVDVMTHGKGRIWCLACHADTDRDKLRTMAGESVAFQDAHLVCGGCHFARQQDWYFGAHGKRQVNWDGPRVIQGCSSCHDPHEPAIQPREPKAPPPVRAGLPKMQDHGHVADLWPWLSVEEATNMSASTVDKGARHD